MSLKEIKVSLHEGGTKLSTLLENLNKHQTTSKTEGPISILYKKELQTLRTLFSNLTKNITLIEEEIQNRKELKKRIIEETLKCLQEKQEGPT